MKWFEAVKQWNTQKGGKYVNPKKGTADYNAVKAIMDKHNPKKEKKPRKPRKAAVPAKASRSVATAAAVASASPFGRAALVNQLTPSVMAPRAMVAPVQMQTPVNTQEVLKQMRLKRMRAAKRNEAVAAVEQIGKKIQENPRYYNQKIDEFKDVYVATHPRPLAIEELEEWRDDLKIWMWSKIAALDPPASMQDLPQSTYVDIMEYVPFERMQLNIDSLPQEARDNIEDMAIPEKYYEAMNDEYLEEFLNKEGGNYGPPPLYGGVESLYDFQGLDIMRIGGHRYFILAGFEVQPAADMIEWREENDLNVEDINQYFEGLEIEELGKVIRKGDAGYDSHWEDEFTEYVSSEYAEFIPEYREYFMAAIDEEDADIDTIMKFPEWMAENHPERPVNDSIQYDEDEAYSFDPKTERLIYTEYEIRFYGCRVNQLPIKGADKMFMNYYIERKMGQQPPLYGEMPAAAQASFNAEAAVNQ